MNMNRTPFDAHAEATNKEGYHNHRVNTHSDVVSDAIVEDLWKMCATLRKDLESGRVGYWKNKKLNWGRKQATDLIIAPPLSQPQNESPNVPSSGWHGAAGIKGMKPDLTKIRVAIEHKSVATAHRNRDARYDDLNNLWQDANTAGVDAIVGGTVMVGLAKRFLNVPDRLKFLAGKDRFGHEILPRLKAHDKTLADEFPKAISENTPKQQAETFRKFNTLPRRPPDRSRAGLDVLLLCPIHYDNIGPARVARDNPFGIDVDAEYKKFLERICTDYSRLWPARSS